MEKHTQSNVNDMVKKTIVHLRKRTAPSRGGKYDSVYVTIPLELFRDPEFPFALDEPLLIYIEGKRLILAEIQEQPGSNSSRPQKGP